MGHASSCLSRERVPTAEEIGLPADRFKVKRKIGSGAEGETFLMVDKTRDKNDALVAVKVVKRGIALDEERLVSEIVLQSGLTHINIIKGKDGNCTRSEDPPSILHTLVSPILCLSLPPHEACVLTRPRSRSPDRLFVMPTDPSRASLSSLSSLSSPPSLSSLPGFLPL